jgi:hypothetical protein
MCASSGSYSREWSCTRGTRRGWTVPSIGSLTGTVEGLVSGWDSTRWSQAANYGTEGEQEIQEQFHEGAKITEE